MAETKPFASLSPTLLARKGGARPAMRPQLAPLHQFHEATARQFDDLGWNDMGHEHDDAEDGARAQPFQAEIVPLPGATHAEPNLPEVIRHREAIAVNIARTEQPRRSALSDGRRAAFTLRLDAERHLKLRLACTVSNRSAQQIVTEALDRLLADSPDITALAGKIRRH